MGKRFRGRLLGGGLFGSSERWLRGRLLRMVTVMALMLSLLTTAGVALGDEGEGVDAVQQARQQRLSLGRQSSCVVVADDTVRCWGNDPSTGADNTIPQPVLTSAGGPQLADVVGISADADYDKCALLGSSQVQCWGRNARGQLGNGAKPTESNFPVTVLDELGQAPLSGVSQIAHGQDHVCALLASDGSARCWGLNSSGQLGSPADYDNTGGVDLPVQVVDGNGALMTGIEGISAARDHTCALMSAGSVRCWGNKGEGQLGTGDTVGDTNLPTVVALPPGVSAVALSAGSGGGRHSCVITTSSGVYCWGRNDEGQLGNGTFGGGATPQQVVLDGGAPLTGVIAVSTGSLHTCALLGTGQVRCWGGNGSAGSTFPGGMLGTGEIAGNRPNPQVVVAPDGSGDALTGVQAMSVGGNHTCAVLEDWTMVCWGLDSSGQLGNSDDANDFIAKSSLPVFVHLTDPLDRAPLADPQAVTVLVGATETITLSGSDPDGDTLGFAISTPPTGGALSAISAVSCAEFVCTATVDYTPNAGVSDAFSFTVNDGFETSDPATVSITVQGNGPPTANDDAANTPEDTVVTIDAAANDTDPDDNLDPTSATVTAGTGPTRGTVLNNGDGTFTYTPADDLNGPDSFDYQICDFGDLCATATVTITVDPVPDAPNALDDAALVEEEGTVDIDVLANDSDPDGDSLTVIGVSNPANGTATINVDGTVTYEPEADFCGDDSFDYTIDDGTGRTDTAVVGIDMECVDDPPSVSAGGPYAGVEGAAVDIAGAVTDPDGAPTITWSYQAGPLVDPGATCEFADAGLASTTVTCDDDGTFTLTITADDGINPPVAAEANVVIDNHVPEVDAGPGQSADPDTPVTVTATFTDDGENDTHSATIDWGDGNGAQPVTIGPLYTVTATFAGYPTGSTATVSVEVCDDDDDCGTDDLVVTTDSCDIRGSEGSDILVATEPGQTLCGFGGDDLLIGTFGNETLLGGAGDDTLRGLGGNDILDGGSGARDRASWVDSPAAVSANLATGVAIGEGADTLLGIEDLFGSAFDDQLVGSNLANQIFGQGGNDFISGLGGEDELYGGNGGDSISGGGGDDLLLGGEDASPDNLRGDGGNDRLFGQAGNDPLSGGRGNDTLNGGPGADVIRGGSGADIVLGQGGNDSVLGGGGPDNISGGSGADRLLGQAGNDILNGNAGADVLLGGSGSDTLHGGSGANRLNGGPGNDICSAGPPAETQRSCNP